MERLTEFSAEAKKTLISLIDSRIEERLKDRLPTREDFSELKSIVQELAQSQQELAQAQKRTEKELRNLARQVGGLSDRMGGSLEDLSYDVLPACIEKYHGIKVDELGRDFIRVDGKEVEVNVFGKGRKIRTGKEFAIIGEAKSNITLKEVDRFLSLVKKIRPTIKEGIFTLLFGFRIHLDARQKAKKQGVHLFVSYGKEL
jgi:hypothetical protein